MNTCPPESGLDNKDNSSDLPLLVSFVFLARSLQLIIGTKQLSVLQSNKVTRSISWMISCEFLYKTLTFDVKHACGSRAGENRQNVDRGWGERRRRQREKREKAGGWQSERKRRCCPPGVQVGSFTWRGQAALQRGGSQLVLTEGFSCLNTWQPPARNGIIASGVERGELMVLYLEDASHLIFCHACYKPWDVIPPEGGSTTHKLCAGWHKEKVQSLTANSRFKSRQFYLESGCML